MMLAEREHVIPSILKKKKKNLTKNCFAAEFNGNIWHIKNVFTQYKQYLYSCIQKVHLLLVNFLQFSTFIIKHQSLGLASETHEE